MSEFADVGLINIGHDLTDTGFYVHRLHLVMDLGGQKFEPERDTESRTAEVRRRISFRSIDRGL